MSGTVELTGTVGDLFGHRFTLETEAGKKLIDLGPGGEQKAKLSAGLRVGVKGEEKPSEIKASSIRISDGEWQSLKTTEAHAPTGSQAGKHGHEAAPELSDEHVTQLLDEGGYSDHAERIRKPKHVEAIATKDGGRYKVHVHRDGVRKADPIG